jgi:hypothetical protein
VKEAAEMSEKTGAAVVSIHFLDIEIDDDAYEGDDGTIHNARAGGTAVAWTTLDIGAAETLREQLTGLFGESCAEMLMPAVAHQVMKNLNWPGSVRLETDEDET